MFLAIMVCGERSPDVSPISRKKMRRYTEKCKKHVQHSKAAHFKWKILITQCSYLFIDKIKV